MFYVNEIKCNSSGILRKDCNIVNSITIYLTATLIGIRVVVGG